MEPLPPAFWSISATEMLEKLQTAKEGLTSAEAGQRLARFGAKRMAQQKVIVKRLASIENFGSMNVFCSDKTGTLTEGIVHVQAALDVDGKPSDQVLLYAYLNAFYETGFTNPIDEAIRTNREFDLSGYQKQDEIPYDFLRKRLSIVVSHEGSHLMVTKGALENVLAACSLAEAEGGKERIILALKKAGNVVGYMGDGINDASALHAADVGISVESAVDVAKDAADIVLLEKDLGVLVQGVREGRTTFANTLKYVFMATSANFGNMFSMAGVSIVLPFLPLLPKQVLLTNLLTDFPEMTIATDLVDDEMVDHPRRWDIAAIRKFMITFGLVSSIFDYLTFGALLFVLHADQDQFRTGWFLESVISASLIVLVIRSRKPFYKSKPGKYLLAATLAIVIATLLLPFTPLARIFGFVPLPIPFLLLIGIIIVGYIAMAEMAKRVFYQKVKL